MNAEIKKYLWVSIAVIASTLIWVSAFYEASKVPNPISNSAWSYLITNLHIFFFWGLAILGIAGVFISVAMIIYPEERKGAAKWIRGICKVS